MKSSGKAPKSMPGTSWKVTFPRGAHELQDSTALGLSPGGLPRRESAKLQHGSGDRAGEVGGAGEHAARVEKRAVGGAS